METLKKLRLDRKLTQSEVAKAIGISYQALAGYEAGRHYPSVNLLDKLAKYYNVTVDELIGRYNSSDIIDITAILFPIIGSVRAGYDGEAIEDKTGDYFPVPQTTLAGHPASDYFVLRVVGDSMYPRFLNGDKVLVKRCDSVDSGTVAVILYNGDEATIKTVEYRKNENWLRLVPANPMYPPKFIEGHDLEQCRVLGKVIYLFRENF